VATHAIVVGGVARAARGRGVQVRGSSRQDLAERECIAARSDALDSSAPADPTSERPSTPSHSGPGRHVRRVFRVATAVPTVVGAGARLAGTLSKVAVSRSDIAPARGDRRFTDPTWTQNLAYRRLMQAYLAACGAVEEVVEGVKLPDWRDRERARFVAGVLTSTLAPTNTLLGNPAAVKRAFETGGGSLRRGVRNAVHDIRYNGGMPRQVDRSAYTVGKDLAATPGAVVYRSEVLELLQYRPVTEQVRRIPVVVVPPQINKYYFMDLAPGRSLIEFAVGQRLQVFAISWRNPTREQREWDLDTYAGAVLDALDAVATITRSRQVNLFGLCAGGITTSTRALGEFRCHVAGLVGARPRRDVVGTGAAQVRPMALAEGGRARQPHARVGVHLDAAQ
jgi:polyhydroxyalkanoate synthase